MIVLPDAVKMLGALRDVEGLLYKTPDPCGDAAGPTDYELTFFIDEVMPPDSKGDLAISASCLSRFPALAGPREAAVALFESKGLPGTCE